MELLNERWNSKDVDVHIVESDEAIVVYKIIVSKSRRSEGIGTKVMQDICKYADVVEKRVELSPSKDFGASSVTRLKKFYKQFGFVENKGRNKDYEISHSMYRLPN